MRRQLGLLGLFVIIPAAAALAPLLVIPAITSCFGAQGWASVALGLSVGVAAAVVAELGWSIVGPQRAARDEAGRADLFDRALASRIVAVAVVAPIAGGATAALVDEHRAAAVILTLGVLVGALSPSWFFTGLGRPLAILMCETLPRMAFALASALVISAGGPLEIYGVGLLLAALVCAALASTRQGARLWPSRDAFRRVPDTVRSQAVLVAGRGITTVHKSLPVVLVGLISPGAVASFAALDRPLRMALSVVTAVPNRLQSWIGVPDAGLSARRSRISLGINALLGVVCGTAFAGLMPGVARVLFSGVVEVSFDLAALGGVLIAVICLSRGYGLCLVAAGRANDTTSAAAVSAVVALACVPLGTALGSTAGAVTGLIAAEAAGVLVQFPLLGRANRGRPVEAVSV